MAVSPSSAVGIVAAQRRREIESGRDERKREGRVNAFRESDEKRALPLDLVMRRKIFLT